jgi:hypothetical protein
VRAETGPVTEVRWLRLTRKVWAVVNAVALAICLVVGIYAIVAWRPMPIGAFAIPLLVLFATGVLTGGLSRLPPFRRRLAAGQPMSAGGGRLLRALLTAFLLMMVIGSLTGRGRPAAAEPGCPYPLRHRGAPVTCVTEVEYRRAGASNQLVGAGILGSGFTAFAAPVLSPLVTAALAAVRRRRKRAEMHEHIGNAGPAGAGSVDDGPADAGSKRGQAGLAEPFDKGFGQLG